MFVLEQEEYAREDIQWDFVNFGLELQPTIDLIEGTTPLGVLACLEDASITRKNDASVRRRPSLLSCRRRSRSLTRGTSRSQFTNALHQLASTKPVSEPFKQYTASRLSQGFTIAHYAGKVEYRTDGWIDKNRDPLNDSVTALLARSGDDYVKRMYAEYADVAAAASTARDAELGAAAGGPRTRVRKGNFRTVGQRHKEQLSLLLSQLHATQPHFVRCIVPNPDKSPSSIDVPLVLDQLRCNGVLEGIRIARLGYPNRLAFADLRRRFELLLPLGTLPSSGGAFVDGAEACATILRHAGLDPTTYRLGLTKAFFKAGILAELEERRDAALSGIVTRVQAAARRFVARRQAVKVLHRAGAVRTLQRNARIYAQLRAWPWWPLFQRVRPLLAAARSDDELRRREHELAEARKRADDEERVRRELEERQAQLERDQDELARSLEQERQLGLEQVGALERAAQREVDLQAELDAAQGDYDAVAAQLDEVLSARRAADSRLEELGASYAAQTKLVETLQAAQAAAKQRETELERQTSVDTLEWERVRCERGEALERVQCIERELGEAKEDRRREQERLGAAVRQLEGRVGAETKASTEARAKFVALEVDARAAKAEVAALQRARRDGDESLRVKEGELARLRTGASPPSCSSSLALPLSGRADVFPRSFCRAQTSPPPVSNSTPPPTALVGPRASPRRSSRSSPPLPARSSRPAPPRTRPAPTSCRSRSSSTSKRRTASARSRSPRSARPRSPTSSSSCPRSALSSRSRSATAPSTSSACRATSTTRAARRPTPPRNVATSSARSPPRRRLSPGSRTRTSRSSAPSRRTSSSSSCCAPRRPSRCSKRARRPTTSSPASAPSSRSSRTTPCRHVATVTPHCATPRRSKRCTRPSRRRSSSARPTSASSTSRSRRSGSTSSTSTRSTATYAPSLRRPRPVSSSPRRRPAGPSCVPLSPLPRCLSSPSLTLIFLRAGRAHPRSRGGAAPAERRDGPHPGRPRQARRLRSHARASPCRSHSLGRGRASTSFSPRLCLSCLDGKR